MDVCPNCGELVSSLNSYTGWCDACSGHSICERCNRPFKADQKRKLCPNCRHKEWLEQNADLLEQHLATGITLSEAIKAVRHAKKPRCHSCGKEIASGLFCFDKKCRQAFLRYRRNKFLKHMNEEEAIKEALAA